MVSYNTRRRAWDGWSEEVPIIKKKLDKARSNLIALRLECKGLEARLPETAVAKEFARQQFQRRPCVDRVVWLELEGEVVSELLFRCADRRRRVIDALLRMPPRPHSEMKLGKPRWKRFRTGAEN